MHLNKILEQIKRHQSPTEAIDKLATALEKHEGSLLEKGFTILKSELAANMYEAINGPHFDEEMRRCEDILKILNINSDITTNVTKDFKELDDLKAEVKELKQLLQNVSAVRPEVIKNTPPNSAEDKKVEPEGEIKKEI